MAREVPLACDVHFSLLPWALRPAGLQVSTCTPARPSAALQSSASASEGGAAQLRGAGWAPAPGHELRFGASCLRHTPRSPRHSPPRAVFSAHIPTLASPKHVQNRGTSGLEAERGVGGGARGAGGLPGDKNFSLHVFSGRKTRYKSPREREVPETLQSRSGCWRLNQSRFEVGPGPPRGWGWWPQEGQVLPSGWTRWTQQGV